MKIRFNLIKIENVEYLMNLKLIKVVFRNYFFNFRKDERMQILKNHFADLKIKGKFNLSNPDQIFWVCENHIKLNNETPFIKNKYL